MENNFKDDRQQPQAPQEPLSYSNTQPQIMQAPPNVLGAVPSVATCPSCGVRRETKVQFEPNTKTHLVAFLICLLGGFCCCCCIPYCSDSCQSAKHTCSNCGAYVGTHKN